MIVNFLKAFIICIPIVVIGMIVLFAITYGVLRLMSLTVYGIACVISYIIKEIILKGKEKSKVNGNNRKTNR